VRDLAFFALGWVAHFGYRHWKAVRQIHASGLTVPQYLEQRKRARLAEDRTADEKARIAMLPGDRSYRR
jgi:hypothetical protein